MSFYISDEGATHLKQFKFAGVDNSLVYRFVLTPMNNYLLQFVPIWMAPNLITSIGLCFVLSACVLTYMHSPNFTEVLPPWLYFWCGFCLFAYQTIDNLDGKQARRTGTSSPLGLLFDHGIDAVNTVTGGLVMAAVFQTGVSWNLFALVFWVGFTPFMWATWEEYYTGVMNLGIINGPTDGVLLSVALSFIGAMYPGIYAQPIKDFPEISRILSSFVPVSFLSQPFYMIFVGFAAAVVVPTILNHIHNVYVHTNKMTIPLSRTIPFYIAWTLAALWAYYSPSHIFHTHPRLFLLANGALFCNLICKMMLAHLCDSNYSPFRMALLPLTIVSVLSLFPVYYNIEPVFSDLSLLYFFVTWSSLAFLHFVYHVIKEMTRILQIQCFTIPVEKQEAAKRELRRVMGERKKS